MNWKLVIRDTLIVYGLTFVGGFFIGFTKGMLNAIHGTHETPAWYPVAIGVSNIVLSIVGFTVVGALRKFDRVPHLLCVAILVWIAGLPNIYLVGITFLQWLFSVFIVLIAMGIGLGLSFLVVRSPEKTNVSEV